MRLYEVAPLYPSELKSASDIENPLSTTSATGPIATTDKQQLLNAFDNAESEPSINALRLLANSDLRLYGVNTYDRGMFKRFYDQNQKRGPFTNRQRRDLSAKLKEYVDVIIDLAQQKGVDLMAQSGAPAQRSHTEKNIGLPDQKWLARQQQHVQQIAEFIKDLPEDTTNKEAANVVMQSLPGQTGKIDRDTAENVVRMLRARIDHEKKEQIRTLQRGFGEPRIGPHDWQTT